MSRTTQGTTQKNPSPIQRYINFKADSGKFVYWDKQASANVELEELKFVLLDTRSSITGWSDSESSKIYSNLVRSTKNEQFNVRSGKTVIASGLYSDIKDSVIKAGGKFCVQLFALDDSGNPICINLDTSKLKEWSTFCENKKRNELYNVVLIAKKSKDQQKKGKVKFYTINFSEETLPEDLAKKADEFDKDVLQPYFNGSTAQESSQDEKETVPY